MFINDHHTLTSSLGRSVALADGGSIHHTQIRRDMSDDLFVFLINEIRFSVL